MRCTFGIFNLSIFLVVFLQRTNHVRAECVFDHYSYYDSGIFLQRFGEENTVVNFQGNPVRIPDQGHIEVFCSSGFRFPGHPEIFGRIESESGKDFEEYTNVSIVCLNGDMLFSFPGGLRQDVLGNNLVCRDNKARFHKAQIAYCNETGFIYGFMVKDYPIAIAEFCYNVDEDSTQFIHFVGGKRAALLEKQIDHNPSVLNAPLLNSHKYVFPKHADMEKLMNKKFTVPGFKYIAEYKLEYLAPIANFSPHFGSLVSNYEFPNVIPMWTTLKTYNWRIFEENLKKESGKVNFEIFTGTSGKVHFPYDLRCNASAEFKISEPAIDISVPLHVWYYIKIKDSPDAGVVIVAVNTPLFEVNADSIICTDICDTINWMKPLSSSRKISSLGYIYCCKPQSVAHNLAGFPVLDSEPKRDTENTSGERHGILGAKPKAKQAN